MSALWTSADAVAATGGKTPCNWAVTGLSIDTRELQAGDMFVALKDVRDGHDFVAAALEKGAAAALVSHVPDGLPDDAPLLVVDDVLAALEGLARAARARTKAKVIGVTGSVGKTGTKEMLRTALEPQGRVHAAVRSFNNHWGVPLTLARMPADTDFAIIEIGMNHPGEISPLAKLADLDAAVVTIVAAVHMAAFKDVAEIAHAKAEIFDGLRAGGTAIINADIDTVEVLRTAATAAKAQIVQFGETDGCDYHLKSADVYGITTSIGATVHGQDILFKLNAPGRHLAMNALAVLASGDAVGADLARSMLALGEFTAPDGRGARQIIELAPIEGHQIELIDESYNANPTSMAAALAVLAAAQPIDGVGNIHRGRRIAILGDMLELGPNEAEMHASIADLDAVKAIDMVICVGKLMQNLFPALPIEQRGLPFETAADLAATIHQILDAGDVVMVKGSNGSRVSQVAAAIENLRSE